MEKGSLQQSVNVDSRTNNFAEYQTYRLTSTAHYAFRSIIPEPQDREVLTWRAFPLPLYTQLGLLFLAYLSRRPNTRFLRMLVLPTVILSAVGFAFGYAWTGPIFNVYNWSQCQYVHFSSATQAFQMYETQVFGQR